MLTELEWQLLFREFQGVQFNNFAAIFSGDLHAIRSLFASPHTDNLSQRVRATLIRYAVIKNNLPILCEIIKNDQHDYINKKIIGGKTFLH